MAQFDWSLPGAAYWTLQRTTVGHGDFALRRRRWRLGGMPFGGPSPTRFGTEGLLTGDNAAKWHYLDASAMVKLVANDVDEEPGRAALREYYFAHGMYRATSYCVAEALSAFKTKWLRGRISQSDYVKDVREFFRLVVSSLHIDEVPLAVQVRSEAERLVEAYGIDFIDSIQVVTLMAGKYSVLVGPSQSLFITADRELAAAARREGAWVWECTTEGSPSARRAV